MHFFTFRNLCLSNPCEIKEVLDNVLDKAFRQYDKITYIYYEFRSLKICFIQSMLGRGLSPRGRGRGLDIHSRDRYSSQENYPVQINLFSGDRFDRPYVFVRPAVTHKSTCY